MKAHSGSDVGQPLCPEVVPPHPVLDRAKEEFDYAAPTSTAESLLDGEAMSFPRSRFNLRGIF
jgi:hypothetical protein